MEKSTKKEKKLSPKLEKLAQEIESLNLVEMAQLSDYLEEKFGVSPMAVAQPVAGQTGGEEKPQGASEKEEKSTFTVVLSTFGSNKLAVIKALREIQPNLGLMEAKKLVESAPKEVMTGVKKEEAEAAKKKLESAGAKVELK